MGKQEREQLRAEIETKLKRHYGCSIEEAGRTDLFRACALVMRDRLAANAMQTQ